MNPELKEQLSDGVGAAAVGSDDTPRVRVVPIAEGDTTTGLSGETTYWGRDVLQDAVESGALDGAKIIKGRPGSGHKGSVGEQAAPEDILGRVDEWMYEDGVGPVGESVMVDEQMAARIEHGLLEISPDFYRRLGDYDESLGAKPASQILSMPYITVLDKGAGANASIEPAMAEALGYNATGENQLTEYEEQLAVSTHQVEYSGTSEGEWSSLARSDFPDDADLSEIDNHFLISQSGFPPENFGDLGLEVVNADGELNLNALESAYNLAPQVDGISDDDVSSVRTTILNLADENWDDHDVGPGDDEEQNADGATILEAHREQLADHATIEPPDHYVWFYEQSTDGEALTVEGAHHATQPFYVCVHGEGDEYPDLHPSLGPSLGEAGPFDAGAETGTFTLSLDESIAQSRTLYAALHEVEMGGEKGEHMMRDGGAIMEGALVEINGEQLAHERAQHVDERPDSRVTVPESDPSESHTTMSDDNPELREQLAKSQDRVSDLEDTREQLAEKNDDLEEQLSEVTDERDDIESERDDLKSKSEQLSEDFAPIKEAIAELAAGDSALTGEQLASKFTGSEIIDMLADEEDDRSPAEQVQEQLAAGVETRGNTADEDEGPTDEPTEEQLAQADDLAYEVMGGSDLREAEQLGLSAREYVAEHKGVDPVECNNAEQLRSQVAAEGGD